MTAFRIPRDPGAFSLDRDRKSRAGRRHDRNHLDFIRDLPCTICGTHRNVEAAHIRFPDPAYGKGNTGLGTKPDDRWTTPLCDYHHRAAPDSQHNSNEADWWAGHGIDPLALALKLHAVSGDESAAEVILAAVRKSAVKA